MKLTTYLQNLIKNDEFIISQHFRERQNLRKLKKIDVKNSLIKGQVIEHLYRYGVGEKYVVHCQANNKVFHIVVIKKFHLSKPLLKTIYTPNEEEIKFENDLKTRLNKRL